MSKYIEIYAPLVHLPPEAKPFPNYNKRCVKVTLPAVCIACYFDHSKLVDDVGDEDYQGSINGPCSHYRRWSLMWPLRVINSSLDPKEDGCNCAKCGEWYHMAAPNQPNGTMICWVCRNH